MLRRKLRVVRPEPLEKRILLAADLFSTVSSLGRVERVDKAPEAETIEVRTLTVEPTDYSIVEAPRNVAQVHVAQVPETKTVEVRTPAVEPTDFSIIDTPQYVALTPETKTVEVRTPTVEPANLSVVDTPRNVAQVNVAQVPETKTVEVRTPTVESTDLSIVEVPRKVVDKTEAPTPVGSVASAITISKAEPVAVKAKFRELDATDSLRVVATRFEDAIDRTVDVFKQRVEPTVLLADGKVAKTLDETLDDSPEDLAQKSHQTDTPDDRSERSATESTTRDKSRSPRDVSARESAVDERDDATDAAMSEENGSIALAASSAAEAPPNLMAGAAAGDSRMSSMSSERSATSRAQSALFESSDMSIAMQQSSPAEADGVGQGERLPMVEGAVFAVVMGAPLLRFATAPATPADLDGGAIAAPGAPSMPRARSRRRRGKERPTPHGTIDDLPVPSRAEPFSTPLTVAIVPSLPKRDSASRRPLPPQLVDRFVAELATVPDVRTASRNDRSEGERPSADEPRRAESARFSAVIAGGTVAAGTIAMLAYERVLRYHGNTTANKKTRPVGNATTRARCDS